MTNNKIYQWTTAFCFLLPILFMSGKVFFGNSAKYLQLPESAFDVQMYFTMDSFPEGKEVFIKTYLPQSNQHQDIQNRLASLNGLDFSKKELENIGTRGEWRGTSAEAVELKYAFQYSGKALKFEIDPWIKKAAFYPEDIQSYLDASEYIQSDHVLIQTKADILAGQQSRLVSKVRVLFDFVHQIPAIQTSQLLDAVSTLKNNAASCNGKSRLLTALMRASGIPARVVGGIILENAEKKTSHLWVEAWLGNQWVTFDPLNGHFAYLPENYLQLYKGDYFLITRTPNVAFDYQFKIAKVDYLTPPTTASLSLWPLLRQDNISPALVKAILLLPLCALIIGVFKNVIGLKTIGVFLPALIAITLDSVGFGFGLVAFLVVIGMVATLHFPLERWGILHTPKLLIMLLGVVISLLLLSRVGIWFENDSLMNMIYFPIVILTIAAEKFAKTIGEEGFEEAVKLQLQTLLLILICYCVYQADFTISFFLSFPETYLLIIGVLLALGRWIGLRFTELFRFKYLAKA